MAVLINDLEVILEPPPAEAGEAPPETRSSMPAPAAPMSPLDVDALITHLAQRESRVRAH